ncbi:hypothetical protein HCN51_13245 [Nonomuraea sp. FMUSA5-5]|uniref:Transposase n=1 Tax=Nonomuraea composti TaxID=2720023 RepID=A0ABX1B0N4_9ACTN|nr:hypothetical protein [Nonomuraea sp. FMUSA5-5]NJP90407.1 hypothetical protein [Nonomuraea sp. FMUSA5-5]
MTVLRDRDTTFTSSVDEVFAGDDIQVLEIPPQATRANACAERRSTRQARNAPTGC